MKLKALALSIALAAGVFAANAQTAYKGNDVFVGIGGGVISTYNFDFNTPAFYGNIMVGKYITPVFGVRGVIGGPFQTLDANNKNAINYQQMGNPYSVKNKLFGELNLDGMVNFSNIFADDLAKFDVYAFVGPTLNLSSKGTEFADPQNASTAIIVKEVDGLKARVGATAGLGLGYNVTNDIEIALEGRFGVTPSVFGDASAYRKAEGTGRVTLNAIWTIGGKHGKYARAAAAAAAAGYLSKEAADELARQYAKDHPVIKVDTVKVTETVTETKYVETEVPASTAVFFEINKSVLTEKDKARLKLYAESLEKFDGKVSVAGYADKATGSVKRNQTLSEQRAQAVYDYLVSLGVPASKLEKSAHGGVGPIFFNNDVLSRTVILKATPNKNN
ncbi:MAG: OmpA family protein [Bacteroidales bacterium]|nr:OmpA family protein [Bacteroidales bacterium]